MIAALLLALNLTGVGAGPTADGGWFRERIAPVLGRRCVHCHDAATAKGGLNLSTAAGLLQGGESGPAVVPGEPEESLLWAMIEGEAPAMPIQGPPLTATELADLRTWIEQGASWPEGFVLADLRWEGQRWWAFEPLVRPSVPPVRTSGWARNPIDRFILAALEGRGLAPAPEADRRTLIRRLTFDLIGLPPTPEEIEAFVGDEDPLAYEKLVDRLLASPHHGERWGRHWLDQVHYGDTHGYDKDKRRDHAWPYRDYVIRAFNEDRPYGQFVREQVAGDLLEPGEFQGIAATGFLAAGPWDFVGHVELREGTVDKKKAQTLDRDDILSSTMATFVSLTVHCARCHDHKFDPIRQSDYYGLQAVFAGLDRGDRSWEPPEQAVRRQALTQRREELRQAMESLGRQPSEELSSSSSSSSARGVAGRNEPGETDHRRAMVEQALADVERELAALPPPQRVYGVLPRPPRPIWELRRGDVEQPGAEAHPGALACVAGLPSRFALDQPENEGTRRVALAEWLTAPENVLTWRSIANRLWVHHFGRGIVQTPNDFGRNGVRPTHPELLDWLAVELRDGGQSLKTLHRSIVTSAVYRQDSRSRPDAERIDADNRFLWRQNRRRLEAEAIRDSVLAVCGTLDRTMGGPGFDLFRFKDDHSPVYDHTDPAVFDNPQVHRRTVYRFTVRSVPNPFLEALDCADPNLNTPVRMETLTALQALVLLNDRFMVRQAAELARWIEAQDHPRRHPLDTLFLRALGRPPRSDERAAVADYATRHGLAHACRLIMNTNEFLFID